MFKERLSRFIKKEVLTLVDHSIVSDFNREIEECFEYFERKAPNPNKNKHNLMLIHGSRVEIGRIKDKEKGFFLARNSKLEQGVPFFREIYSIDNGRVIKTKRIYNQGDLSSDSAKEPVDRKGLEEIVKEIHNITIPYKEYVDSKAENKD